MEENKLEFVSLPKDGNGNLTFEPFECGGKRWKMIKPGDPIGLKKWTEYQKLQIIAGFGVTFADLINGLKAHKDLLSSDQKFSEIRSEAIVWADSQIKGLIDLSRARFDKAFYLCSLFIYEDGTDPAAWSMEQAEKNIECWADGRLNEQDLFFFAMLLLPAWNTILNELDGEAGRQAARSLVGILLKRGEE